MKKFVASSSPAHAGKQLQRPTCNYFMPDLHRSSSSALIGLLPLNTAASHHNIKQQLLLFLSSLSAAALLVALFRSSAALPHHNPRLNTLSNHPLHRHLAIHSHSALINPETITVHEGTVQLPITIKESKETIDYSAAAIQAEEKARQIPLAAEIPSPQISPEVSATVDGAKNKGKTEDTSDIADVIQADPQAPLLGPKVTDWDEQRLTWLAQNPNSIPRNGRSNMLLVTGSRPKACENPSGDHSLLIFMKNKVDYCRLHGIEIFYNMAQLNKEMAEYWSKLPLLRTLMLSHPEMEWLWWMDSDAMITDMTFELPMEKYEPYNLIIPGNREDVFMKKSWVGLNAGIFIIRNCQWTLDLIDTWALMGPKGRVGQVVGKTLSDMLPDRPLFDSDDQSSLIYLLLTQKGRWESKVFLESSYCLHGYWLGIVDRFEELAESSHPGYGDDRWPFVTHFVGCKPCGRYPSYEQEQCLKQMERAFNFADNQVLQQYGFQHKHFNTGEVERAQIMTSHNGNGFGHKVGVLSTASESYTVKKQ